MSTLHKISRHKIIFIVLLLLSIPLLLYLIQVQQENRSRAQKASTLRIEAANENVAVGQNIDLDIVLTPGSNLVSIVELHVQFDDTHFFPQDPLFTPNTASFPVTIEEAFVQNGEVITTVSIGSDPTKTITQEVTIGTLHLTASQSTSPDTQISFSDETSISSLGPDDDPSENVLASTTPAVVTITGESSTACGEFAIPDGNQPAGLSIVGSEIWVANLGNNGSISRLHPDGTRAAAALSDSDIKNPESLAVIDNEVWIANTNSGHILRYSFSGLPAASPIDLPELDNVTGHSPNDIAIVNDEVWVTDSGQDKILRFDLQGNFLSAFSTNGLTDPTGISVVGNEVWVTNRDSSNEIYRFNFSGEQQGNPIGGNFLQFPTDIAVVRDEVWVTNLSAYGSISRFTKTGEPLGLLSAASDIYYPAGLLLMNNSVWVTSLASAKVHVLTADGDKLTCATLTPTGTITITPTATPTPPLTTEQTCGTLPLSDVEEPGGIVRVNDEMWVGSFAGDKIARLRLNGLPAAPPIGGNELDGPIHMAVVDDEVWVINYVAGNVLRFDKNGQRAGQPITLASPDGASLPRSLAVVGDEVWIIEIYSGSIFRFDKNGSPLGSPIQIPNSITTEIVTVNNEAWVIALDFNSFESVIHRFDQSGNKTETVILNNVTLILDAAVVDDTVWMSGFDSQLGSSGALLARVDKNGNSLGIIQSTAEFPLTIAVANNQVWVTDQGLNGEKNIFHVYTLDGSYYPCPESNPKISFSLLLDGIGNAGDRANPNNSSLSNKSPVTRNRDFQVEVFTPLNELAALGNGALTYNSGQGAYTGDVILSQVVNGDFTIKLKSDGYLKKTLPGIQQLAENKTIPISQTSLVAGDVNGDDRLDILDYNILRDCGYGATNPLPMSNTRSTSNSLRCIVHNSRDFADVNDNGTIDSHDYNLFIRELNGANVNPTPPSTPTPTRTPTPTKIQSGPNPTKETTLSILPNPVTVSSSTETILDIYIQTGSNRVAAAQLELSYDPNALEVIEITPGTFMTNPVILFNTIDPANGTVSYALGITPSQSPVQGSGVLAQITVRKKQGITLEETEISFRPLTLVSSPDSTTSLLLEAKGARVILSQ